MKLLLKTFSHHLLNVSPKVYLFITSSAVALKVWSQSNSVSITWKSVRNKNFQVTVIQKLCRWDSDITLIGPPGISNVC